VLTPEPVDHPAHGVACRDIRSGPMPSVAYAGPLRSAAFGSGRGQELGCGDVDVLADGQPDGRLHGCLDRRPAHLAVALRRVAVPDREPAPARRQAGTTSSRRRDGACPCCPPWRVWRDRAQWPRDGCHAHLAAEWRQGHVDPGPVLRPPGRPGDRGHLVERRWEVVGQQPETRDVGGPSPTGRRQLQDVDLERITGFGPRDPRQGR
jgi:hypothetical protein